MFISNGSVKSSFLTATSVIVATLVLSGCNPSPTATAGLGQLNPGGPGNIPAPSVPSGCAYDRFVQPPTQITGSIDLLFVTHTTQSFLSVRNSVAAGIDSFVAHIPSSVDFRIGVLLAHSTSSPWNGVLYSPNGVPAVLNSQTMSLATIRADLQNTLTNTVADDATEGGEEGTSSLNHALDPVNFAQIQAQGFFRPGAALAVVFLANEADICGLPSTDPGSDDDWSTERTIETNTCGGITPLSVYQKLRALRAGAPTLIAGAVYTDPNQQDIGGVEAEYGWGYMDMIQLAQGMTISLANGQFTQGMQMLGDLLTIRTILHTDFTLSRLDVDPASVQVHLDGLSTPFSYQPTTNEVHIDPAGSPNSTIDVIYCPGNGGTGCVGPLCGVLIGI